MSDEPEPFLPDDYFARRKFDGRCKIIAMGNAMRTCGTYSEDLVNNMCLLLLYFNYRTKRDLVYMVTHECDDECCEGDDFRQCIPKRMMGMVVRHLVNIAMVDSTAVGAKALAMLYMIAVTDPDGTRGLAVPLPRAIFENHVDRRRNRVVSTPVASVQNAILALRDMERLRAHAGSAALDAYYTKEDQRVHAFGADLAPYVNPDSVREWKEYPMAMYRWVVPEDERDRPWSAAYAGQPLACPYA